MLINSNHSAPFGTPLVRLKILGHAIMLNAIIIPSENQKIMNSNLSNGELIITPEKGAIKHVNKNVSNKRLQPHLFKKKTPK